MITTTKTTLLLLALMLLVWLLNTSLQPREPLFKGIRLPVPVMHRV